MMLHTAIYRAELDKIFISAYSHSRDEMNPVKKKWYM